MYSSCCLWEPITGINPLGNMGSLIGGGGKIITAADSLSVIKWYFLL